MNTIMTMPWALAQGLDQHCERRRTQKVVRPTAHSLILVSRTFHKTRHCPTGSISNLHKHLETRQVGTETDPVRRLSAV